MAITPMGRASGVRAMTRGRGIDHRSQPVPLIRLCGSVWIGVRYSTSTDPQSRISGTFNATLPGLALRRGPSSGMPRRPYASIRGGSCAPFHRNRLRPHVIKKRLRFRRPRLSQQTARTSSRRTSRELRYGREVKRPESVGWGRKRAIRRDSKGRKLGESYTAAV